MTVFAQKDGRWVCVYFDQGKRRRKYFGKGPGAERAAWAHNASLGLGEITRDPAAKSDRDIKQTVQGITEAYLAAKGRSMPESSFTDLMYKLTRHILPELGHLHASRLSHARLDAYANMRITQTARGKAARTKATTVHRELSILQAILNWAVKTHLLFRNPVAGHAKPRRDDDIITPPSPEEVAAIMAAAPEHLRRAIMLSYYTGLRPGASELLALRWEDVDLAGGTITIRGAKKGGPAVRRVPLHDTLLEQMKEWAPDPAKGPIITYRGEPVKRIKTAWDSAKERAGITRRIRPYDLRHAAATAMLEAGADLKSVSEMIGHSRVDTTLRTYHHTTTAMHRGAIAKLIPLPVVSKIAAKKKKKSGR